jgi:pimeloyl-ACP methyl ester carboxylesterase
MIRQVAARAIYQFRPVLVVWTPEDRVQRPAHGRRLAQLLPDARLLEIPDSFALIMRGQPRAFTEGIRRFVRETAEETTPARLRAALSALA